MSKFKHPVFLLAIFIWVPLLSCGQPQELPKPVHDIAATTPLPATPPAIHTPVVTTPATPSRAQELVIPKPDPSVFASNRSDDLYPQATKMPDSTKISMTWLGNGFTRVEGLPGAIPGTHPIYVVSPNTAHAVLTKSNSDGSFDAEVIAPPGSWVIVKYDPLNGIWLYPEIINDLRPGSVNAAPGTFVQVPFDLTSGEGTPFVLSGSTFPGHIDFTLNGLMTGDFSPGGSVSLTGTTNLYVSDSAIIELSGKHLDFDVYLAPLFDAQGRGRMEANQFFSNILTPTGLPVEHWGGPPLSGSVLKFSALQPDGENNRLTTEFEVEIDIPDNVPDGTYGLWLSIFNDTEMGSLGGPRPHVNPFMTNHSLPFPPFRIGHPDSPHLIWTLLTDVPSADGSRGTIAIEDAKDFQVANRIATQSHNYIIPRLSKETGEAITYRLEPYLPMVSHGDRYIPNVPNFTFKFPSGSLEVQITDPDGVVETIGPVPFTTAHTRTPTSKGGMLVNFGGGHLAEVFQLSTGSSLFDYQFPLFGQYRIKMTGTI